MRNATIWGNIGIILLLPISSSSNLYGLWDITACFVILHLFNIPSYLTPPMRRIPYKIYVWMFGGCKLKSLAYNPVLISWWWALLTQYTCVRQMDRHCMTAYIPCYSYSYNVLCILTCGKNWMAWSCLSLEQEHNFGLKSAGYWFRRRMRRPWFRSERGGEWGASIIPFSSDSWVWESVMSSLNGSGAENGFIVT